MFDDLTIQKISKKRKPDKVIKSVHDVERCPFCNSEISLHMDMPITYMDFLDVKLYNCLGAEKHKFSTVRDRVRHTTFLEIFDRTNHRLKCRWSSTVRNGGVDFHRYEPCWPNLNELLPKNHKNGL